MKMLEISQSGLFLRQDLVLRNILKTMSVNHLLSNKALELKRRPDIMGLKLVSMSDAPFILELKKKTRYMVTETNKMDEFLSRLS